VFDVTRTPSRAGKLTESFRQRPGVLRSLHPSHSITALGPLAEWLTRDHHRDTTPFGPNSPFVRLIEAQGKILCLAVKIAYMTSYHVLEDSVPDFSEPVYTPEIYDTTVIDSAGARVAVKTRAHDTEVSMRRIEKRPEVLRVFQEAFRTAGILHEGTVGLGFASLIGAREMHQAMERLFGRGITIYARLQ